MASPLRQTHPPTPTDDDLPPSAQATVCAPPDPSHVSSGKLPAAPSIPPYTSGTLIAQKYELIRMLGEGGMGAVWVARNVALDAHVGLKLIRAEVSKNVPGVQGRLLQEARAAASLGHPAIIRVFDFGTTERGDPFITMELLHGESLADLLTRRSKVSAVRAVQTLLPIVDALAAAHATGIIHRDLKPDNIFLSRDANGRIQPKVLDFGIAKLEHSVSPHLTREGTVLGSPAYMSPEQARGHNDVDARSDIWALSVVLYQMMTGELPFVAENNNALLWSIVETEPIALAELGVNEPELWTILARGLEKKRENRWPVMFDLGKALAAWLVARGVEEDICHARVRATWLESGQRKPGDVLHSFFPSDPPYQIDVQLPVGTSVPITLSGEEEASGVRATSSSPDPDVKKGATTEVASLMRTVMGSISTRRVPRWVLAVVAPLAAFLLAAAIRTSMRSRVEPPHRASVVPSSETARDISEVRKPPVAAAPQEARSQEARSLDPPVRLQPHGPPSEPVVETPAAASAPPARPAIDRNKPARRASPKRKSTELKDPFR